MGKVHFVEDPGDARHDLEVDLCPTDLQPLLQLAEPPAVDAAAGPCVWQVSDRKSAG
jgi:hypothetical protein